MNTGDITPVILKATSLYTYTDGWIYFNGSSQGLATFYMRGRIHTCCYFLEGWCISVNTPFIFAPHRIKNIRTREVNYSKKIHNSNFVIAQVSQKNWAFDPDKFLSLPITNLQVLGKSYWHLLGHNYPLSEKWLKIVHLAVVPWAVWHQEESRQRSLSGADCYCGLFHFVSFHTQR